jgi:hypothetical protein
VLAGLIAAVAADLDVSAAGHASKMPVAVAVARVSMLGYLGAFFGPALIGLMVTGIPLAAALLLPPPP